MQQQYKEYIAKKKELVCELKASLESRKDIKRMSFLSKEENLRLQGAKWAFDAIEDIGIEKAKDRFAERGAWGVSLASSQTDLNNFMDSYKACAIRNVCSVVLLTLLDEFDFTKEQLLKFEKRFNIKADSIDMGLATFEDYGQVIMDEVGIDVDVIEK